MGCDIHMYCEYRDKDGKWINCDHFKVDPSIKSKEAWNDYKPVDEYDEKMYIEHIYNGRDYNIFGILAGVRSCEPERIDDPRGLPDDINWVTKIFVDKDFEEKNWGYHSQSYLLASEIFNWKKKQKRKWKKAKKGKEVHKDGFDKYVYNSDDRENFYVDRHHELDYLISRIKQRMQECFYVFEKEDYDKYADKFRIVFWFDS